MSLKLLFPIDKQPRSFQGQLLSQK
jgi:hypothetical protein